MEEMTKQENPRLKIAELLTAVNNQYRVEWDALALEMAVNCFETLIYEDLKKAASLWMLDNRWPPTIADLKDYYLRIKRDKVRALERLKSADEKKLETEIMAQHSRAESLWLHLTDVDKQILLQKADKHPLRQYMSSEAIAKNILLFGDGHRLIGEEKVKQLREGDGYTKAEDKKV